MSGHQQHRSDCQGLMTLYGKRWGIECGLRDTKDMRFGMEMGSILWIACGRPTSSRSRA